MIPHIAMSNPDSQSQPDRSVIRKIATARKKSPPHLTEFFLPPRESGTQIRPVNYPDRGLPLFPTTGIILRYRGHGNSHLSRGGRGPGARAEIRRADLAVCSPGTRSPSFGGCPSNRKTTLSQNTDPPAPASLALRRSFVRETAKRRGRPGLKRSARELAICIG